jgi:hypothetical protein
VPIAENPVYQRLTALTACLCAEIQDPAWGVPEVCFCGLTPGESAIGQYAGDCNDRCGMAWVRLVGGYPMRGVGQPDETPGNCGQTLGVSVEMGIMRCMNVGDDLGNPPPVEDLVAAVELQVADMLIMQRALYCCAAIPAKEILLGVYQPLGPEGAGGLVGGTWSFQMGV